MKAFFVKQPHEFRLIDSEIPRLAPHDVLVRVGACGICGSDLDIIEGSRPMEVTAYPLIAGHEFAGRVEEVGSAVGDLRPGDKVAVDTIVGCGRCRNCLRGWGCHCLTAFNQLGCTLPGGMAEFAAVERRQLYRLPAEIDVSAAALCEPAGCAAHGVSKADLRPGDNVVIVGCGPIGALALQTARLFSPARLILVEIDERKLRLGERLGATHTVNARTEDVPARVLDITRGAGADAVIECTGAVEPIRQSFSYIGVKGRTVIIGVPPVRTLEVDFLKMLMQDSLVRPSNGYTREIWLWVLDLLVNGFYDAEAIITHRLPLSEVTTGFRILQERQELACKVMLV